MVVNFSSSILKSAATNAKTLKMVQHILSLVNIGRHKLYISGGQIVLYEDIMDKISIFEEVIRKYALLSDKSKPEFFVVIDKTGNIMEFEKVYNVPDNFKVSRFSNFNKVYMRGNQGSYNYECEFVDMRNYYSYVCDNLKVILEDKISDGSFLAALIRAYKGTLLDRHFDIEDIDIEGAGGCVSRYIKANTVRNRIFTFVDSDKKHKLMKPSDGKAIEQKRIVGLYGEFGYRVLLLKKKEIENYIPDNLLIEYSPNHIYHTFTNEQKAFFDLKYGLRVRDFVNPLVSELYSNILTEAHMKLIEAFRKEVQSNKAAEFESKNGEKVLIEGFGKNIFSLFRKNISKEEFDKIDYYGEFKEILKWIKRYA